MIKLNLPKHEFSITRQGRQYEIFDSIRNKYVVLTPEEWVRQNFIAFLIHHKKYPKSLIAIEKKLLLNKMSVRPDIVVYNNIGKPMVIVECKAPNVKITQGTFDQIAKYNFALKARYLIVTNGIKHFACKMNYDELTYQFIREIPLYKKI